MNKNDAKDYLPLVQALADGKTIQQSQAHGWVDIMNLSLTDPATHYRIKPEPFETSIWVHPTGEIMTMREAFGKNVTYWRLVRLREIT